MHPLQTLKGFICNVVEDITDPYGGRYVTITLKNQGKIYYVQGSAAHAEELKRLCEPSSAGGHRGEIATCQGRFIPECNAPTPGNCLPYIFISSKVCVTRKQYAKKSASRRARQAAASAPVVDLPF